MFGHMGQKNFVLRKLDDSAYMRPQCKQYGNDDGKEGLKRIVV
jgi:hypothetical protein